MINTKGLWMLVLSFNEFVKCLKFRLMGHGALNLSSITFVNDADLTKIHQTLQEVADLFYINIEILHALPGKHVVKLAQVSRREYRQLPFIRISMPLYHLLSIKAELTRFNELYNFKMTIGNPVKVDKNGGAKSDDELYKASLYNIYIYIYICIYIYIYLYIYI